MIPNPRKKKQTPGFPLEKARVLWAKFPAEARDMTFTQFYKELCSLNDEGQMKKDLETIQMTRAIQNSNQFMVERALQDANR